MLYLWAQEVLRSLPVLIEGVGSSTYPFHPVSPGESPPAFCKISYEIYVDGSQLYGNSGYKIGRLTDQPLA